MGKRSVKENKNIYQTSREELGLSREAAAEVLEFISPERIEKIESGKSLPHPDEILIMADSYRKPNLSNYYCSHECPIGRLYVPPVEMRDLPSIVLEMLALLNSVSRDRDRLIEIASNGRINDDEYEDFSSIHNRLEKLALTVNELRVWLDGMIMEGKVDKTALEKWKQLEQSHL